MTDHHSLEVAAQRITGGTMKHPVLWTRKRIKDGTFRATKVGRHIRMTDKQIEDAIAALEIGGQPQAQEQPRRLGVTAASMRRRAS